MAVTLATFPSALYAVRIVTFVSSEGAQPPELELLLDDELPPVTPIHDLRDRARHGVVGETHLLRPPGR